MVIKIYADRVSALQDALLKELETLNDGELSADLESHTGVQAADMVLEYESLLRTMQVCLNTAQRGFQVKWTKSSSLDACDSLEIAQNEEFEETDAERAQVAQDVEYLLRSIDWLFEYKNRLRNAIKEGHQKKIELQEIAGDQSIEDNLVNYETQYQQLRSDVHPQPRADGTTKDKLLSKTKQLSANLIRGNQVLQSAVLQSDLNLDELREQSSSLSKINDKYTQLDTVFTKTSQLVKTLEKASHQEKRDVYFALGFLCMCVSWVLWRRIFKLPVKLALWLTFKFFKGILVTIGLVKDVSAAKIAAPPISFLQTTTTTASTPTTETIEQAIDEAMGRIFDHDEL